MLFLRPYSLKRTVVKGERPKAEADIEAGEGDKSEKIVDADASQLAAAPAPGTQEDAAGQARRSISKTRTSEANDDAGTIAGEPEVPKQ